MKKVKITINNFKKSFELIDFSEDWQNEDFVNTQLLKHFRSYVKSNKMQWQVLRGNYKIEHFTK